MILTTREHLITLPICGIKIFRNCQCLNLYAKRVVLLNMISSTLCSIYDLQQESGRGPSYAHVNLIKSPASLPPTFTLYPAPPSTEDPRYNDSVCYQIFCCKIEFAVVKKLDMDPSKACITDIFEQFFYKSYVLCIC